MMPKIDYKMMRENDKYVFEESIPYASYTHVIATIKEATKKYVSYDKHIYNKNKLVGTTEDYMEKKYFKHLYKKFNPLVELLNG